MKVKEIGINYKPNRQILQKILLCSYSQLLSHEDYQLTKAEYYEYQMLYYQYTQGVPIEYILGYSEFYNNRFIVNKDVLIPRCETELLVTSALHLAKTKKTLIDIGTGSGCIAISCKLSNYNLLVTATDKYMPALLVAKQNAAILNADIEFIESDLWSNIDSKFDVIVSNPPYIHPDDEHLAQLIHEPIYALTDEKDGLSHIKKIILESVNYIENNGVVLIEHGYNQAYQVQQMLHESGYISYLIKDYQGINRISVGILD